MRISARGWRGRGSELFNEYPELSISFRALNPNPAARARIIGLRLGSARARSFCLYICARDVLDSVTPSSLSRLYRFFHSGECLSLDRYFCARCSKTA